MTIKERIAKLEKEKFLLETKDFWDDADYAENGRLVREIEKLKKDLTNQTK